MGPSMRETTVILLSRRTISARNGYELSFNAWETVTQHGRKCSRNLVVWGTFTEEVNKISKRVSSQFSSTRLAPHCDPPVEIKVFNDRFPLPGNKLVTDLSLMYSSQVTSL